MLAKRGIRTLAEPGTLSKDASTGPSSRPGAALTRTPPHNIEAEEGVLACCLMAGQELVALCLEAHLEPGCFFLPAHQDIFQAMLELYEDGVPVEEIALTERLERNGKLESIGGYATMAGLASRIDTPAHASYWLAIVRDNSILRRLIRTATESIEKCYTKEAGLDQILDEAEQGIFKLSEDRVVDSAHPLKHSIDSASQLISKLLQNRGELTGVPTGFTDLDKIMFGLHRGEMIILAARPSLGKTSMALNIAESAVLPRGSREAVATLFFSLEMSAVQLAFRLLCSHTRVNMLKIREGTVYKEDNKRLAQAAIEIKDAPLWIDDSGHLTILEMRAKSRRMAARIGNLGLIIIDYLQLVSGTDNRVHREQQISEISRGLKAMAKELDVPILVLSQLNRESEREKRLPRLSDLRESGSIEQDADVVLLLANRRRDDDQEGSRPSERVRELIVAKQRNGPIGNITLTFVPELTRFENFSLQSPAI